MDQQDIDRLLGQMTNFYTENLPMDPSFVKLLHVYGEMFRAVFQELKHVDDSSLISTTPILKTMPYFKIDASDGFYSAERATQLNLLSFEQQILELDRNGAFVRISFAREQVREPIVYALTLKQTFAEKEPLALYQDYFLRANKIYILPSFILNKKNTSSTLHAFDIKVDDKRLERNWGIFYDLELGPFLPRHEYRDTLRGFERAMIGNATIKSMKEAIKAVTNWQEFDLQDVKSRTLAPAKKRLYDQYILSPAQFLVSIPEIIVSDRVRISILLRLLDELREPNTNYMVFYDFVRDDIFEPEDTARPTYLVFPIDKTSGADSFTQFFRVHAEDTIANLDPDNRYDNNVYYDYNLVYDGEILSSFDGQTNFDNGSFDAELMPAADHAIVNVRDFPEIPRNFAAALTATPGVIKFTFRSNTDGTEKFELMGATAADGPYVKVDEVVNDQALPEIELNHDANVSGKTYYRVRSAAGVYLSLLTLSIDITTLS